VHLQSVISQGERVVTRASQLITDAWMLRGISSIPGQLRLAAGRLTFTALNTGTAWKWQLHRLEREMRSPGLADRIDAGERTLVFDFPVEHLHISFPWYYFTGGMKLGFEGRKLRISFGRPPNTRMPVNRFHVNEIRARTASELKEIRAMRGAGSAWKEALTGRQRT
jgi:hypothetical protein